MPGVGDWIGDPLSFVSGYLGQYSSVEYKQKVTAFFTKNITTSEECKQWIPSFNSVPLHDIQPNTLIRFRCMVQDMFGPEYYYDVFETENTSSGEKKLLSGRYRDVTSSVDGVNILQNSAATQTSERHIFYCVPVPGESEWVKEGHKASCMSPRFAGSSNCATKVKRSLEEDASISDCVESMDTEATSEAYKRVRTANGESCKSQASDDNKSLGKQMHMNFPLPGETGSAALIKMYDDFGESMKINDIIEVYGIVSTDPALSQINVDDTEMLSTEEQKAHNPPASLVPRIHAVYVNKLHSVNPLLKTNPETADQLASITAEASEIREHLLGLLEQSLCGDKLCAEYLLLHLLSSVYMRREMLAVGKLSLNITKIPSNEPIFVTSLIQLIQQCVTSLHYLPMTLDNMNKLNFTPSKDYDANRLKSGILQLADRCHLVLDETAMQPGQLDVNGVKNLTGLGNLVRWQKVSYDFKYHQQDFDADVPVLTLSEGKSLLPSDLVIPLHVDTSVSVQARHEAIKTYLSPNLLDKIRIYLSLIPTLNYEMGEDMTKMVQEDFVSARQANKDAMSADDLQSLLVLTRALSISYGHSDLSADIWSRAKCMEEQRKLRLSG